MKRQNYALWVALAFGLVFACAHSFTYVEGDDATSLAYHLLGRDAALQPPYAAYNGMMDRLLSFLPASEPVLRGAAFGLTALAAVVFVLLALKLAFDWLGNVTPAQKTVAAGIVLLSCPELFFLGLAYIPNLVALAFIVGGHLALRRALAGQGSGPLAGAAPGWTALSLALFGLGVSCRWETITYGAVVVADVWLGRDARQFAKQPARTWAFGFVWGALALVSALAFIALSGYGPKAMFEFYQLARKSSGGALRADTGYGLRNVVGIYQPFFTPAFALLLAVGLGSFLLKSRALAVKALIGALPVLPQLYYGDPKLLLAGFPGLALCAAAGVQALWFARWPQPRLALARAALVALLVGPWLIGLRIHSKDTQWGPGFEVRTATPPADATAASAGASRSIGMSGVSLAVGSGFAVSTPEGPRPFGGFAAVLLGGEWRRHLRLREQERRAVIAEALAAGRPVLQDDGNSLVVIHLLELGFTTRDRSPKAKLKPGEAPAWDAHGICRRVFTHADGRRLEFLQLQGNSLLFKSEQLEKLVAGAKLGQVVLHSGYSSTLAKLFRAAPQSARALGPFSAIVELPLLHQAMEARATAQARTQP
jgi:hypothetical protein